MERLEKQQFIRRIAAENQTDAAGSRVYWSRHAILEMVKDNLTARKLNRLCCKARSLRIMLPGIVCCRIVWFWLFCPTGVRYTL
jgi:hypothetical protein